MNVVNTKKNKELLKTILFYLLLFLLSAALAVTSKNYDNDIWARLIAGMSVVQTGQILKYDFLSFTPTHPWYDHEWGSSVIFYLVQSNFGHIGLLTLQVIMIFLTMLFLVKTVKVRCENICNYKNILIYFIVLNSFMVTYSSLIRCHSFSFLFFIFELYILEKIRKTQNNKLFFIFPFLFLIWGNMHGGVFSGLGLLVLYAIGECLNKKQFKYYIMSSLAGFLVLFINPYGIEYVKFLIKAITMKRPDVVEWWCIFHKHNYKEFMQFKFLALFYIILEFLKCKKIGFNYNSIDKTKFLVLIVTLSFAIAHVKMMPFFALSSTVFCYEDIYSMFKKYNMPKHGIKIINIVLTLYAVLMLTLKNYSPMVNFEIYPIMEIEFLKANHITGKIVTNFGIGSYTAYKLYPQNKIYMDGRYEEVYNPDLLYDLKKFYMIAVGYDSILKKYNPDIILMEKNYRAYNYMKDSKNWIMVFDGLKYGVFIKPEKYRKNFVSPNGNLKYYQKTVFNTDIKFKGENSIDINKINRKKLNNAK